MLQKQRNPHNVQLIIAALNEEPGIGLTITEMKDTLGEIPIIVVDGKSSDRTTEIAKHLGAKLIYQDGVGKGDALAKALKHIDPDANYIILTDADHTYPAEYVPTMIKILDENPLIGMVCGNRLTENVDGEALHTIFRIGNKILALLHTMLNGITMQDPLTGLRVIRAEILRHWQVESKGFDIEVELNSLVSQLGYRIKELPISYRPRLGEKKLKISHGITIFKRILLKRLALNTLPRPNKHKNTPDSTANLLLS